MTQQKLPSMQMESRHGILQIHQQKCAKKKAEKKAMHIIQLMKMKKTTTDERWSHAYMTQLDCFCVETFAFRLITNYMKHSVQFTITFKSI